MGANNPDSQSSLRSFELDEFLLQLDGPLWIVAGRRHVAHAVLVGFTLGVAPVLLHDQLCAHGRHQHGDLPRRLVFDLGAQHHHAGHGAHLREHAGRLLARAMRCVRVHDFMAKDRRQFGLGFQFVEQAPVDHEFPPRQGPGVGARVVQDTEFKLQYVFSLSLGREPLPTRHAT
jgi:hypothetical protein